MNSESYQALQIQINLSYIERMLHKYHKVSEFLSHIDDLSKIPDSYPTFIEELERLEKLSKNGIIKNEVLNDLNVKAHVKIISNNEFELIDILDMSECDQTELIFIQTLAVIVYNYCSHDYHLSFAKHSTDCLSDKEANDYNEFFVKHAYSNLKDLKNLLLFREEGHKSNSITIDKIVEKEYDEEEGHKSNSITIDKIVEKKYDEEDKKDDKKKKDNVKKKMVIEKENQIIVNDPLVISKLANILINEKLQELLMTPNQYVDVLKFQFYTAETITYKVVNEQFEAVKSMVEKKIKRKLPSKRSVFKGLISKLVKKYVRDEQLTMRGKPVDERDAQLIAYWILSMYGFISLDLINRHKNRDARIKYMDSLPAWNDNPILPNRMEIVSPELVIKKYSPSESTPSDLIKK